MKRWEPQHDEQFLGGSPGKDEEEDGSPSNKEETSAAEDRGAETLTS